MPRAISLATLFQLGSAPAGDGDPKLVPYLPDQGDTPAGAVIVLPGGGYRYLAEHEGEPVARAFNARGLHAFVLHYRVAPHRYPAPQQDVLRAVRLVRHHAAEFGIDPNQIAVCGFSAGGHLAGCSGLLDDEIPDDSGDEVSRESGRPDALILGYPAVTFTGEYGRIGSPGNLLGERSADETLLQKLSLQRRVTAAMPPTFIWHTADDQTVSVRHSLALAEAAWQAKVDCALHIFPRGKHGLGLAADHPDLAVWPDLAVAFLRTRCRFHTAGPRP